jgi:hypothetical protein
MTLERVPWVTAAIRFRRFGRYAGYPGWRSLIITMKASRGAAAIPASNVVLGLSVAMKKWLWLTFREVCPACPVAS